MTSKIVITATAVTAVAAALCTGVIFVLKRKAAKNTAVLNVPDAKPVPEAGSSDRETVKVVAATVEPSVAFDDVYRMTRSIWENKLPENHPAFVSGALVYTNLNVDQLPVSKFWMELCMHPESLVPENRSSETTQIFIDRLTNMFLIVDGDEFFSTYLDKSNEESPRFILSGPCYGDISTAGYLELILEKYVDTWGL